MIFEQVLCELQKSLHVEVIQVHVSHKGGNDGTRVFFAVTNQGSGTLLSDLEMTNCLLQLCIIRLCSDGSLWNVFQSPLL